MDGLVDLLRLECCADESLSVDGSKLVCAGCKSGREVSDEGIVLNAGLDQAGPSGTDGYEWNTKHRYQSLGYAEHYTARYAARSRLRDWYPRFVTGRERAGVDQLMSRIHEDVRTVLDIPAGTGKLAPVHANYCYAVIAADVSAEMLRSGFASGEWGHSSNLMGMLQTDITAIELRDRAVDCTVCLRLMHRLPESVMMTALGELARVTRRYLIVSNAVRQTGLFSGSAVRRRWRNAMDPAQWRGLLRSVGTVEEEFRVSSLLSSEVISLVRISSEGAQHSTEQQAPVSVRAPAATP